MDLPKRKVKAPVRYTPDTKPEELKDDISVDSDWDEEPYGKVNLGSDNNYDYSDGFVVKDEDEIEYYDSESS